MRTLLTLVVAACALAAPARAQETGAIVGQVFDADTGVPLPGVVVVVIWPAPPEAGAPRQETRATGDGGDFEFGSVAPGTYEITFQKPGYRDSRITAFEVQPGQPSRADFPLPPLATDTASEAAPGDVEEFVVVGAKGALESLELRVDSDELLNVLSAEELSRFAATDVAEGLKRVAGVNVVDGQFAIIRGLEDRYSATLWNSAPIPSPDPDRQSVQLDLFPSEVVSNLIVAKTFAPELPSNAAGGSVNIVSHDYPYETFAASVGGSVGINENAFDDFLGYVSGSPVGEETSGADTLLQEYGGFIGGRTDLFGHEIRYKAVLNWDLNFGTAEGWTETREPRRAEFLREGRPNERVLTAGGGALGELLLTGGRYELTASQESRQATGYGGFGFDLDQAGNHRIDTSVFYTRKKQELVELKDNGYLAGFDYSDMVARQQAGEANVWQDFLLQRLAGTSLCGVCATQKAWIASAVRPDLGTDPSRGPLWFTHFSESKSFDIQRDLLVTQVNGDHFIDAVQGLHLGWAANYATTTQDEEAIKAGIFYEPDNETDPDYVFPTRFPVVPADLGPGAYAATQASKVLHSANSIDESQWFGRLDGDYEIALSEVVKLKFGTGGWYETATRNVESRYLENALSSGVVTGPTRLELGRALLPSVIAPFDRDTSNESNRQIWAWNLGSKATLWERADLLGGFRLENIQLESINDPFTTDDRFGAPATFPESYLFFDRLDNPGRGEVAQPRPPGTVFNDQVLGIDVPVDPDTGFVDFPDRASLESVMNSEIDELHILPTAGFALRPLPGVSWKTAWSQTVARPSFREMGFYASLDPDTDDLVVGNPQLRLSEVTSYDTRLEYSWGELGDFVAISPFYKTIENPIESILVNNPINSQQDLWRTWFNNPNTANVWGIEVEARKYLDFIPLRIAEFVSIGGNYTYIHAEVDRSDAELARDDPFFRTPDGAAAGFTGLDTSRRLFNQPEWIVNLDMSFDHPDWGTRISLAYFAISDVLDAAGASFLSPDGRSIGLRLDRYLDSYGQLDLVLSQSWSPGFLGGGSLTFKASLKNLTDSTRGRFYDPNQTHDVVYERRFKLGRQYKFGITYSY